MANYDAGRRSHIVHKAYIIVIISVYSYQEKLSIVETGGINMSKSKKKFIVSRILIPMLIVFLIPAAIFALNGSSLLGSGNPDTHSHSDMTAWTSTNSLPTSGSYYLANDVNVASSTTLNGTLNLCLNGKTVTYKGSTGSVFVVKAGFTFNLYDEEGNNGVITGGKGDGSNNASYPMGGNIYVVGNIGNPGHFNMYGGTVTGGSASQGGNVAINRSTFNMYGGVISNGTCNYSVYNQGGNVYINGFDTAPGIFNAYGGTITGGKTKNGANIYIQSKGCTFNLKNLTVTNGSSDDNYSQGGGIYAGVSCSGTLENCTFTNNSSNSGGAMYITANSVTIKDCTVENNTTTGSGAGMYLSTSAEIIGGSISNNTAQGYAGGIESFGQTITMKDVTVSNNSCQGSAGGMELYSCNQLEMENCTISGNSAKSFAGGLRICSSGTVGTLKNCTISNNTALEQYAGGLCINYGSELTMDGGSIEGNTAKTFAGGIRNDGIFNLNDGTICNNTVTDAGQGGGIFSNSSSSTLNLNGGEIKDNTVGAGGTGDAVVGYNINLAKTKVDGVIAISNPITVTDDLGSRKYTVNLVKGSSYKPTDGVITSGLNGNGGADNFISSSKKYNVEINSDSEAELVLAPHEHDDMLFTAWESTTSLPTEPGNYFLKDNVTISTTWEAPAGTTNFCLNGYGIKKTGNGRAITVNDGANLNIYDCDETVHYFNVYNHLATNINDTSGAQSFKGGYITGGNANGEDTENQRGGGVFVYSGGTFTMNGGTLIGNQSTNIGAAICSSPLNVSNNTSVITLNAGSKIMYNATPTNAAGGIYASGNVNLNGVQITNNYAASNQIGGVNFNGKGTVTVSGATVVKDNYSGENESNFGIEKTLRLGELTDGAYISMYSTSSYYGVNDGGAFTTENGKDYIDFFHVDSSRSDTYILGTTPDGAIKMGKKFTVAWNNYDNSNIKTDELFKDDVPSYDGDTPEKLQDEFYTYTFAGWYDGTNSYGVNDTLPAVTENITYTALYTQTSSHIHDDTTFEAWTKTDSLPTTAGNYGLANDVTISSTWTVPSGTTNLCLNGHGIKMTGTDSVITVDNGATLKIYDCDKSTEHRYTVSNPAANGAGLATVDDSLTSGYKTFTGGYITGGKGKNYSSWSNGGGIYIGAGSTAILYNGTIIGNGRLTHTHGGALRTNGNGASFIMYGGEIRNNEGANGGAIRLYSGADAKIYGGKFTGNRTNDEGGAISAGDQATLLLRDCEISGNDSKNKGGGVWIWNTVVTFSGNTVIRDNSVGTATNNLQIGTAGMDKAIFSELGDDAAIGVNLQSGTGTFTTTWKTNMPNAKPADYFTSDNSDYTVALVEGEAAIGNFVASVVKGDDEEIYTSFEDAVNAWADGSTLKLLKDATTSSTITVPEGEYTLDLNGHGIKMTGNSTVINVVADSKFNLYDCNTTATHKFSVNSSTYLATLDEANGTVTVNGGYITGGNTTGSGGAMVINGTFNMYGGNIIGNKGGNGGAICTNANSTVHLYDGNICYNNTGGGGGAFFCGRPSELYISGGSIHHNKAGAWGGAIYMPEGSSCVVDVSGGSIVNNITAKNGGGIHVSRAAVMKLSGNPQITDNKTTSNAANNLNVAAGAVVTITGELDSTASVGIKSSNTTAVVTSGWPTYMADKKPGDYFTADAAGYEVQAMRNGEVCIGPPHTHSWSYAADGDTITATCSGYESGVCPLEKQTIQISAQGKTYDGSAVTATLTKSDDWKTENGLSDPTIAYSGNTDAGTYTASITCGTATAQASFTIDEKSMADEVSAADYSGDYDGNAHGITVTKPDGATVKYGTASGSYTLTDNPTYTDAGTYTVYYQVTKKNYVTVTGSATVTINQIDAEVTIEGNYSTVDYDGEEHTITGYVATADTALYDVDNDIEFSGDATAKRTNAGKTEMGLAADQFSNTNPNFKTVTFVVTDGFQTVVTVDAIITTAPENAEPIYNGSDLELVTAGEVEGGTLWYALGEGPKNAPEDGYSTSIPTGKSTGSYYVWYKVIADENHNDLQPVCIKVVLAKEKWVSLKGTLFESDGTTPAKDATVTLIKGSEKIDYEITPNNGAYKFTVPSGIYNIVVEYNDHTETIMIDISEGMEQDIVMLEGNTDSLLTVNGDDFGAVVGGLNDEAVSVRTSSGVTDDKKVAVSMTVEAKTDKTAKNAKAFNELTTGRSFMFFDAEIKKTVDEETTVMTSTDNVLEIAVPYAKTSRRGILVYYSDGSGLKEYKEDTSKDAGTFTVDKEKGYIYIYAKRFATFAIGYTPYYRVNSSISLGSFTGKIDVTIEGKNGEGTFKLENVATDKVSFADVPKGKYEMTITWTDGAENTLTMPFTVS